MRLLPAIALALSSGSLAQEPPRKVDIDWSSGWSDWRIRGNENRFLQYATPPRGFYLPRLGLSYSDGLRMDARLIAKAPGQDDYRHNALLRLNAGATRIGAMDSNSRFFDPDPTITEQSSRRVSEIFAMQKIGQDFGITFRMRSNNQHEVFAVPPDKIDQTTLVSNISARGSIGKAGFVDVNYTDFKYEDRTASLPNTHTQTLSASIMQMFGGNLAVGGSYARSLIKQPGAPTDRVDNWTVGGNLLLGDSSSLLIDYRNTRLDMPTVIFAFDRRRQEARARLVHRLAGGWNAQLAYTQVALERLIDDHTFVDVPRLHTVDGHLSGRLGRRARLTASALRQTMQGGARMQVSDPRALYFTSRWDAKLKLEAHTDQINGYAILGWHENKNADRDVTIQRSGLTLGAEWSKSPDLVFYSEFSTDRWTGHTSDPLAPDLSSYFPDATTFTAGSNWTVNSKASATANFTFYRRDPGGSQNALSEAWGSQFTGSIRYRMSKDNELSVAIAPWRYVDRTIGLPGYSTGLVQVTARGRF